MMNRAVRFSLFALSAVIGALLVFLATQSGDAEAEEAEVVLTGGGSEPASPPTEEPDWAELELLQHEKSERRVATMTAAVAAEAVDPAWAPATERQITKRFAAKAPPGFELLSATCKTSLCIAEVQSPSREQSSQQLAWSEFLGLSRGYVHHRTGEGDANRTVVFLARDGHSLPKAIQ